MKTWQKRADDVIAQGCTTYSKRADQFVKGVYPTHLQGGGGCCVQDAKGEGYVDWMGGLGSNLLSVRNNFGLPLTVEVELAEKIRERIPCLEKMKILKTGSEACQAAVRLARAYRELGGVDTSWGIGNGYHGWHNWCIAEENPGVGCRDEGYGKYSNNQDILKNTSAGIYDYCIIEPVTLDLTPERGEFLRKLRKVCTDTNTVLIFDEVITGFRVPQYCVANYYGVQPDLMCLGKALGDGFPLAIVGGKREIMDTPDYFISSTFAGEGSAISSALNVIEQLTPEVLDALWKRGGWFLDKFNAIWPEKIWLHGYNTKAVFEGDEYVKAMFMQEMAKRRMLFGKAWHITWSHNWEICNDTITACQIVLQNIRDGDVNLEGELPQEVFKRN